MSKPSNIILQRQKNKKLMIFPHHYDEHLTRQFSNISSSNEGYHGGEIASVPFEWESQPGTPKVRFKENVLPPLTPPPSYHQKNVTKKPTFDAKKNSLSSPKSSLLKAIFPKRATRSKGCAFQPPQFPNSLSYSSSSSSSSSSSPRPRISYSVPSSPMVNSWNGGEEEDLYDVPRLSLCFGNARSSRGCHSSMFKKVLLGEFK